GDVPDNVVPTSNPIDGVGNPTDVPGFTGIYTEGPVWHTDGLFYSTVGTDSHLVKLTPPSATTDIHAAGAGIQALGNAYDSKNNRFISCQVDGTVAGGPSGAFSIAFTPAAGGAATPFTFNVDAGAGAFDAPNDVVVRKDGIIYVTDPGYQNPGTVNNH